MSTNLAPRRAAPPTRVEYSERRLASMNGYAMFVLGVVLAIIALTRFVSIRDDMEAATVLLAHVLPGVLCVLATAAVGAGLYTLQPNEAAIMTLFGSTPAPTGPKACAGPTRSSSSAASRCARAI